MIKQLPNVNFKVRVRDNSIAGDNPFKWEKNLHTITLKIKK